MGHHGAEHRDEDKIFSLHYKESQFGLSVHRSIENLFIMIWDGQTG
ncbi:hypothetical protein [Gracilimonas amylolytica]|nr:hypothetical protein [Gracilimonas amylolytica]